MTRKAQNEKDAGSWFSPSLVYEGRGTLKLRETQRVIRGRARVSIGEDGRTVATLAPEVKPGAGLIEQALGLQRAPAATDAAAAAFTAIHETPMQPAEFTVESSEGKFFATEDCFCENAAFGASEAGRRIAIHLLHSVFARPDERKAHYWVAPLVNLVTGYPDRRERLAHHPLRLKTSPSRGEAEMGHLLEMVMGPSGDGVILFDSGRPGFIEPLPDHRERERVLQTGAAPSLVTAVMVGEVGDNPTVWTELATWFPFDFAGLLSLASGTPTSIPWVEFRSADGQLVGRFHRHVAPGPFAQEKPVIAPGSPGVGRFLTCAARSELFRHPELRLAVRLLLRARANTSRIDDGFRNLLIALEAMYQLIFGPSGSSVAGDALNEGDLRNFRKVITAAQKDLEKLHLATLRRHDANGAAFIEGAMDRLAGLETQEPRFHTKLELLLEDAALPDIEVLDVYYRSHPDGSSRKWTEALTAYRDKVMFRGYVGISEEGLRFEDVIRVFSHLQDILLRIILKKLGYDGEYQPAVLGSEASARVDWVTKAILPEQLGFR